MPLSSAPLSENTSTALVLQCGRESWEEFVLHDRAPTAKLPEALFSSWKRSKEAGVHPQSPQIGAVLTEQELALRVKQNSALVNYAVPTMRILEMSIRDTTFVVLLSDSLGYTLLVMGDRKGIEMSHAYYPIEGSLRSTAYHGTNSISVCLDEKRPVQVTGFAHYQRLSQHSTCSSAPIFDNNGDLLGAITLSGLKDSQQPHTLGLVTAAARNIESLIREDALQKEKEHLRHVLQVIDASMTEGVIALDNDLVITHLNWAACRLLSLPTIGITGKFLTEVTQPARSLLDALRLKILLNNEIVSFSLPQGIRNFLCRIDRLHTEQGGMLLILSEKPETVQRTLPATPTGARFTFADIVGKSPALIRQRKFAEKAARTANRILISGESGTGKELFAQALHNAGARRNGPFVAISCAALPLELVESELFGYEGGSFTGARREGMIGKIEVADGGTLFLDEINSMPAATQAKLLRFLQQNEIMRIGGHKNIPVNVCVVAATNVDLRAQVRNGLFRSDLFYRLSVVEIIVPPLRDCLHDLSPLCAHILRRLSVEKNYPAARATPEAVAILKRHSWPGNVRELENCLERALIASDGKDIDAAHLDFIHGFNPEEDVVEEPRRRGLRDDMEQAVLQALRECGGNISRAARELGISRGSVYRRLRHLKGIQPSAS